MNNKKSINVLMVTGVYFPEVNGAVLQCKRIVYLLKNKISFSILTTTKHKSFVDLNIIDGVEVFRPYVGNHIAKLLQVIKIFQVFLTRKIDIVHLHGFSSRSALILLISRLFNIKIIIKMTSFGHDDAISIQNNSKLLYYIFSLADAYIGVSPIFKDMHFRSRLNKKNYYQIPNGVDIDSFLPLRDPNEKSSIRHELGLPLDLSLILVVGHFSVEKSADHVLDVWLKIQERINNQSGIVFIGNTDSNNFEVDCNLVNLVRSKSNRFINKKIFFVEKTNNIEQYYQAADIYILPSAREGLPNSLLEAMSCALPVISTRLEGVTDWVINHKVNGMMYDYGDIDNLKLLLENLLQDDNLCKCLGLNARKTIKDNFEISETTEKIYDIYKDCMC
jgi:glycosyltransferase involved in cell wall biosynthesis